MLAPADGQEERGVLAHLQGDGLWGAVLRAERCECPGLGTEDPLLSVLRPSLAPLPLGKQKRHHEAVRAGPEAAACARVLTRPLPVFQRC